MDRRSADNAEVARALREMALFLEMDDVPFKPQAYEKAAYAVAALDQPLAEIYERSGQKGLDAIAGVGEGIARRIAGLIETGKMADLEALRKKTPIDILSLTAIEGIGAKKARALWQGLHVRSVPDLERAAKHGRIRELAHFGVKSERKILQSLALHAATAGRRPLGEILPLMRRIEAALSQMAEVVEVRVVGSIRRRRDTIGDIDVLVAARSPDRVSRVFESLPDVQAILAHGPTKTLVRLKNGMDADLRVVEPSSFGAALIYFTGSKAHNVALRKIAQTNSLKLNEYGLFRARRRIAGRTEEEVYRALGLSFIPPELREDHGEIELAQHGALPTLVSETDMRGDLQVHTNWTDGSVSIEAMARAAQALGREYIAITDHTRDLAMTGGLDEAKLLAQLQEVDRVNRKLRGIRVLSGAEANIRADGSLDIADEVLEQLDLVGAAIHSHFDQSRSELTRRIVRAVENPHVDVLFHPTCRSLGHRAALDFDFEQVLSACIRTGTLLEIDAQPERLDLPDELVRRAIDAGVPIVIDSDAHTVDELRYIEAFGVAVARRGWAARRHIANTLPLDAMLGLLKGRRSDGRCVARRR